MVARDEVHRVMDDLYELGARGHHRHRHPRLPPLMESRGHHPDASQGQPRRESGQAGPTPRHAGPPRPPDGTRGRGRCWPIRAPGSRGRSSARRRRPTTPPTVPSSTGLQPRPGPTRRCWSAGRAGRRAGSGPGLGVRVPGRLGRAWPPPRRVVAAVRRATREGLPLLAAAPLRRDADAGGHARLRPDGGDRGRPRRASPRAACRTWSTCAIRPRAACWPRWAPPAT